MKSAWKDDFANVGSQHTPLFFLSLQKTWLVRIMKLAEKSLCTSPPLSLSHTLTHERTQFNTWEVC